MRFDVLCNLRFLGRHSGPIRLTPAAADSRPPSGLYSRLPGYFQRHRIVNPDSVPALEEYAHAAQRGRWLFVSYRWRDFENDEAWLTELTDTLGASTASCWWDRRHMPQEDLKQFHHLLEDILNDAIRQSAFLVALMKGGYLETGQDPRHPTWVRREWDGAGREIDRDGRRHRMTRVAVVLGDQPSARHWIVPSDVVLRFGPDEPAHNVAQHLVALLPRSRHCSATAQARPSNDGHAQGSPILPCLRRDDCHSTMVAGIRISCWE